MEIEQLDEESVDLNLEKNEVYDPTECVVFFKTKEAFGGLSNMCGGFPLLVDGKLYRTSEALYQTLKFPDHPQIQEMIQHEPSPLFAKRKANPYKHLIREDWEEVKIELMRWCLKEKYDQHPEDFGDLLRSTGSQPIVEKSRKDPFWGAVERKDGMLVGQNVLGKLLVELREQAK